MNPEQPQPESPLGQVYHPDGSVQSAPPAAAAPAPAPMWQAPAVEVGGWNWGAFWLNWIWAIGNGVWIGLLALVPVAGIVMAFILGAKGNQWAWDRRLDKDLDAFRRSQKNWAVAGWVIGALLIVAAPFAAILMGVTVSGVQGISTQHMTSADFVTQNYDNGKGGQFQLKFYPHSKTVTSNGSGLKALASPNFNTDGVRLLTFAVIGPGSDYPECTQNEVFSVTASDGSQRRVCAIEANDTPVLYYTLFSGPKGRTGAFLVVDYDQQRASSDQTYASRVLPFLKFLNIRIKPRQSLALSSHGNNKWPRNAAIYCI